MSIISPIRPSRVLSGTHWLFLTSDSRALIALVVLIGLPGVSSASDESERIETAVTVLEEIMDAPDSAIPSAILNGAEAIAIFPSTIKAGFVFGGHRGRGIIAARHPDTGAWSAPAFLTLTGGSFGLQIGGQSVDLVLVVMNRRGLERLVANQFKIGGGASAVVGPVGRDAEASTDLQLQAEILSYSRTRGVFAGVTLQGSTLRADRDANERFYGERLDSKGIVLEGRAMSGSVPDAVARLRRALAALPVD